MHNATGRVHVAFRMLHCAAALALVVAMITGTGVGGQTDRLPSPSLPHLRGIAEIRDWFNAGKGHVRLVLLLSPT